MRGSVKRKRPKLHEDKKVPKVSQYFMNEDIDRIKEQCGRK